MPSCSKTALSLISGKDHLPHTKGPIAHIVGKRCLVTGGAGSIGSALIRLIRGMGGYATGIDHNEDACAIDQTLLLGDALSANLESYDFVFHCAAYKHVKLGERFQQEFWRNNVQTVKGLLLNLPKGARFVLCSTDKASGITYMGQTKRAAEKEVFYASQTSLRLVNCVGSRGSVIDLWDRHRVRYLCSPLVERYWMSLRDAAYCLLVVAGLPPATYTVYDFPLLTMGEVKTAWCRARKLNPRFQSVSLGETESKVEQLYHAASESLEDCGVSFLRKVIAL